MLILSFGHRCSFLEKRKDETANILLGFVLLSTFHRDAKCLEPTLLSINTLAVLKRNVRSEDVLHSIIVRISH